MDEGHIFMKLTRIPTKKKRVVETLYKVIEEGNNWQHFLFIRLYKTGGRKYTWAYCEIINNSTS